MDGVIFDSERACLSVWQELASELGLENIAAVFIRCVGTNINCNAVCPGFTVTPLSLNQESNATETGAAKKARSVDYLPILHKKSTRNVPTFPIDQAHAALFFGSDLARCITGQIVNVDNGQYL
jgi:NAD(P)-dependent dehydrogenase (short-subunit alcohol dehydrogenase family)